MELLSLLSLARIEFPDNICSVNITQIVSDSRRACAGCLYVCIRGIHNDGHLFIQDAIDRGASAVIVESGNEVASDNSSASALVISVPNTRKALACLFNAWYGSPSDKMKFVAVTGTNGKTSVTYILKKIF